MSILKLNRPSMSATQRIWLVIAGGSLLAVMLRAESPGAIGHTDSSLSLYAAGRLLHGELPYVSVWYDRLPGTVLCDAAALLLRRSFLSVTIMEMMWIAAASFVLARALAAFRVPRATAAVTAGWFGLAAAAASAIGAPNAPQEWALLPATGFFYYIVRAAVSGRARDAFRAGLMAGVATCFLGREAALVLIGLIALRKNAAPFIIGFIIFPALLASGIMFARLPYPFGRTVLDSNWAILTHGGWQPYLATGGLATIKLIGLLAPLALLFLPRAAGVGNGERATDRRIGAALIVWAAIEISALAVGGGIAPTSVLNAVLPLTVILAGRLDLERKETGFGKHSRAALALVFICFFAIASHSHQTPGSKFWKRNFYDEFHSRFIADLVARNSKPDETVLVWSDSALTYVLANRRAPSAYATFKPLFIRGYSDQHAKEFIYEVGANPPSIFVIEASLLLEGLHDFLNSRPYYGAGDAQKPVFSYLQKLVRDDFSMMTVHHGVVICRRTKKSDSIHNKN